MVLVVIILQWLCVKILKIQKEFLAIGLVPSAVKKPVKIILLHQQHNKIAIIGFKIVNSIIIHVSKNVLKPIFPIIHIIYVRSSITIKVALLSLI